MSLSVADKITNDRCLMICKMHVYSGLYNYTEVDIFSCTTLHGCFSSELQCVACAVSCAPQYTCLEVFATLT